MLNFVRAAQLEVGVACPTTGPLAQALNDHDVARFPWDGRHGRDDSLSARRQELAGIVDRYQPELLHANSLSMGRLAGPVAAEQRRIGVAHLRDILKLSQRAVDDLNRNRQLIAVSHATRRHHIAQGIDGQKIVVLYNGVDGQQFEPRPRTQYLHRQLKLSARARLVVSIGQIGLRKGLDVAARAFAAIAASHPSVHWLIVGERHSNKPESLQFESDLRARANQAPLSGRVHFLGSREDVPKLLNECELLIHAAHQEPLGRVLLEAAASGVPVVATEVGGTAEIFPSRHDGAILVSRGNVAALAAAASSILSDSEMRATLARAARQRAVQHFDAEDAGHRQVAIYRKLLKGAY